MTRDEFITNLILLGFKEDTLFAKYSLNNVLQYELTTNLKVMGIRDEEASLTLLGCIMWNQTFERILEEVITHLNKLQEADNAIITRSKRCNGSLFRLPH